VNGAGQSLRLWETLSRRLLADATPWLELWAETVRLPDGRVIDPFYAIEQPDFVVVFPVSSDRKILTIWHYKHGPRRINLGLPAGAVAPGEAPEIAAGRELLEETGYVGRQLVPLGAFSLDANRGSGRGHVYVASDVQLRARPTHDDLEEIVVEWMTPAALHQALLSGEVATMDAATGIAMGLLHLGERIGSG
jgi:ADP-ribose pyrophosphatase